MTLGTVYLPVLPFPIPSVSPTDLPALVGGQQSPNHVEDWSSCQRSGRGLLYTLPEHTLSSLYWQWGQIVSGFYSGYSRFLVLASTLSKAGWWAPIKRQRLLILNLSKCTMGIAPLIITCGSYYYFLLFHLWHCVLGRGNFSPWISHPWKSGGLH